MAKFTRRLFATYPRSGPVAARTNTVGETFREVNLAKIDKTQNGQSLNLNLLPP
jgi:hypothetical protein